MGDLGLAAPVFGCIAGYAARAGYALVEEFSDPGVSGRGRPHRFAAGLCPGCSTAKVRQSWRTSRLKDEHSQNQRRQYWRLCFSQPKTGANPTDFHIGRARAAATTLRGAWWGCPPRLLNELRQRTTELTQRTTDLTEALEQQTATSDVLKVTSSSQGELQRVFETILVNATRLCEANFGTLSLYQAEQGFRSVAMHNAPPAFAELRRQEAIIRPGPMMRVAATKQLAHILNIREQLDKQSDPDLAAFVEMTDVRTGPLHPNAQG